MKYGRDADIAKASRVVKDGIERIFPLLVKHFGHARKQCSPRRLRQGCGWLPFPARRACPLPAGAPWGEMSIRVYRNPDGVAPKLLLYVGQGLPLLDEE
jgi:hypothetical protein